MKLQFFPSARCYDFNLNETSQQWYFHFRDITDSPRCFCFAWFNKLRIIYLTYCILILISLDFTLYILILNALSQSGLHWHNCKSYFRFTVFGSCVYRPDKFLLLWLFESGTQSVGDLQNIQSVVPKNYLRKISQRLCNYISLVGLAVFNTAPLSDNDI